MVQGLMAIGAVKLVGAAIIGFLLSTPADAQTYVGKAQAVDGDSLEIGETRFRLFGIDAVEKHQTCEREGIACYAVIAGFGIFARRPAAALRMH